MLVHKFRKKIYYTIKSSTKFFVNFKQENTENKNELKKEFLIIERSKTKGRIDNWNPAYEKRK